LEYYRRYFSDEKLTYAYNTRNPDVSKTLTQDEIDELMRFKQNDVLIGVNALLTYIKGVDILIKAMPELPGRKLFIAGAGKSQKNLERLAINCGVKDRCFFAGYRKDAYRYLPFYDIFALPSRVEGFPLALLEAAVYKRPCVVSDIHIFKEVLDEKSAAMFPLEQPAKIAEAVRLAEKTPALGENLYRKYKDSFSPEQMYMQYLEIYNNARGDL
jgi:glycosyltransferase involved in cell wall biosynthesis